jgi:hypothetical protein
VHTLADVFGPTGAELAASDMADPQTSPRTFATTPVRREPPANPVRALVNPSHSAIFWIGLAAVLGLVLVSGQVKVEAALGGRAGRKG